MELKRKEVTSDENDSVVIPESQFGLTAATNT